MNGDVENSGTKLYVALIHYPVINKSGDVIASAVTNLDLHDIARASRTYGASGYFIVTPLADQQELVNQILDHWLEGHGHTYNPKRGDALGLVQVTDTLEAAVAAVSEMEGSAPVLVATTSRGSREALSCADLRRKLKAGIPVVLMFGTAWGLAPEAIDAADHVLEPIEGPTDYNHLSVRAAAGIYLDRLMGKRNELF